MNEKTIKITFSIGKSAERLRINLEDFVLSLNANLMRTNGGGRASGEYGHGDFIVTVKNTSMQVVESYLEPFVKAMKKNGFHFILNAREENPENRSDTTPGKVKGELVNRKKILTKVTLGYSLWDADKGK